MLQLAFARDRAGNLGRLDYLRQPLNPVWHHGAMVLPRRLQPVVRRFFWAMYCIIGPKTVTFSCYGGLINARQCGRRPPSKNFTFPPCSLSAGVQDFHLAM